MSEGALRVVIADDHPVFRDGLAAALADRGLDVVAAVGDGESALEVAAKNGVDVVLMDLAMPGIGGVEATRRLARLDPAPAVVVLTMSDDHTSLRAALRAGARGYLLKESTADEVVAVLTSVAAGQTVLGAGVAHRVADAMSGPASTDRPFPELTDREFEVLQFIARGRTNAEIVRDLGIADKTVRNNVSVILTKLAVESRAEAVAKARDAGVGQPN